MFATFFPWLAVLYVFCTCISSFLYLKLTKFSIVYPTLEKVAPPEKNSAPIGGTPIPSKLSPESPCPSPMLLEGDEEQETDPDEDEQESEHQRERKRVSSEHDEETNPEAAAEEGLHQSQYEVVEIGEDDTDMNRVRNSYLQRREIHVAAVQGRTNKDSLVRGERSMPLLYKVFEIDQDDTNIKLDK